jgi:hypothetical protein
MDSNQEHLKNLNEIRSLMERSSSFLSLSGLGGISAGTIGIITTIILYNKIGPFMNFDKYFTGILPAEKRTDLIIFCSILFAAVLIITFSSAAFFTIRKAKKKGLKVWDASAKKLVLNLFIPLVIGGAFCKLLVYHYYDFVVLPSMLVFYGLALLNASKYTLPETRWLGYSEILLGLVNLFFTGQGLYFWAAGFGILHILYGALMWWKYERN